MAKKNTYSNQQIKNLGKRLRALRKEKGFSSAEKFAYQHDINRVQYSRYEQGNDLRFSSLTKVLKALDISLEDFFSEGFDEE